MLDMQFNKLKLHVHELNLLMMCLDPGITGHGLVLPKEEEGGASRANDVVKVQGCGWV